MKKALMLGSAAVAMTAIAAPIAALDIDFSGRSRFHIEGGEELTTAGPADINGGELRFTNDERLHVNVDTSNCCIKYGGMLRLEDNNIKSDIYISGDWGRLDFGNIDDARGGAYDVSVVDAGPLSGGTSVTQGGVYGLDSNLVGNTSAGDASDATIVYAGPALAGFTPKVGWDGDNVEGSLVGTLGPLGLKVSANDEGKSAAMATYSTGDLSFAAFMGEDDDSDSYAGAGVKYSMGALAMSLSGVQSEGKDSTTTITEDDVQFGVSYKIATGLTASASVQNQDNSVLGDATRYKARLQLDF